LEAARQKTSVIFARTSAMHVLQNVLSMIQDIVKNVPKPVSNARKHAGLWHKFFLKNAGIIYLHSFFYFFTKKIFMENNHQKNMQKMNGMKGMKSKDNTYRKLFIMLVLSFISMYILMYSMANSLSNVYPNINQL
jgi:ATP-dependent Zn protease